MVSAKNLDEIAAARNKVKALLNAVGLDLNSEKRKRLEVLLRRAVWLKQRIVNAAEAEKILHYDEAELTAVKWAVNHIIILEEEIKRLREEIANLKKGGDDK